MASINESESRGERVVAKSFVIKDFAEFLAPLDDAIFPAFLELASYLYSAGYKDVAAVICGSPLEGHLPRLSEKLEIAVTAENGPPTRGRSWLAWSVPDRTATDQPSPAAQSVVLKSASSHGYLKETRRC